MGGRGSIEGVVREPMNVGARSVRGQGLRLGPCHIWISIFGLGLGV